VECGPQYHQGNFQEMVECGPQDHQGNFQEMVKWSVVLSTIREPLGQCAMECGRQYHQGTFQDNVQWSVVLSSIRETFRTKCSGVWSTVPSGNLSR
jgi:hypothetical protein